MLFGWDIMKLSWMIGGAQGLGVDTSANLFGSAVAKAGYYIYGNREYYSNIKGRHSYFNVVMGSKPYRSISEKVNILASFDAETVFQHFMDVTDFLIYDKASEIVKAETVRSMENEITEKAVNELESKGFGTSVADVVQYLTKNGVRCIPVNYVEDVNSVINSMKIPPPVAGKAKNTIAIGASYSLLGLKEEYLKAAIKESFGKNDLFYNMNTLAAEAGMKYAKNNYNMEELNLTDTRVQIDGNTLSAMGKMAGGLRFQSYYPITPASDESTYIEANQVLQTNTGDSGGIVVVQSEDELAAINMAVGASLTGARSATATSGPGFSLMSEGISWAGMNEAPVLVTYYMRGAPATGLPTRSGQADLKFALNVGHGEFPRIVIASGDHEEVFFDAIYGLNLAERYQTPVIHIIEKCLANAYSVLDTKVFSGPKISIERGLLSEGGDDYRRFVVTQSGISPRAFLGKAGIFYTGDEHNESGHITEESLNRLALYEKRLKKLETADREIMEESMVNVYGDSQDVVLLWGASKGAALDAMEELKEKGINIEVVQVRMFNPYPKNYMKKILANKRMIIALESNYYAQGAEVLAEKTGIMTNAQILKWTGRPILLDELVTAIEDVVAKRKKRVILDGGA
jgi:2-oxoglutarate ferredoxin oxidoreductase subunit alpha